jgi:hypothetical protein
MNQMLKMDDMVKMDEMLTNRRDAETQIRGGGSHHNRKCSNLRSQMRKTAATVQTTVEMKRLFARPHNCGLAIHWEYHLGSFSYSASSLFRDFYRVL